LTKLKHRKIKARKEKACRKFKRKEAKKKMKCIAGTNKGEKREGKTY